MIQPLRADETRLGGYGIRNTQHGVQDMKATIENGELVIRVPIQPPTASKSGKTLIVATSEGNKATAAQVNGKPVVVGLNAYITI